MAMLAIVAVACSGSSPFQSPTGPTGVAATTASSSAVSGAMEDGPAPCPAVSGTTQDTPEPEPEPCEPPPPPPPPGIPCSPGYWKNHETEFNGACAAAAALEDDRFVTCGDLLTALTCKGSDASCGRHAAAALLNEITGCTEDD
jgi:hypothetical protein